MIPTSRRRATASVVVLLCLATAGIARADVDGRPNILLVVSDDLGWPYYHFMMQYLRTSFPDGSARPFDPPVHDAASDHGDCTPLPPNGTNPGFPSSSCRVCQPGNQLNNIDVCTPNLDKLAREGVAFREGYTVAPDCDDARPSIVTGLNRRDLDGAKAGCEHDPQLPRVGFPTIPQALHALGYDTYFAGKWDINDVADPRVIFDQASTDQTIGEGTSLAIVKQWLWDQPNPTHAATVPARRPWFLMWDPKMPHNEFTLPSKTFGPAQQCPASWFPPSTTPQCCSDPNNCMFSDLYFNHSAGSLTAPGFIDNYGGLPPDNFPKYLQSVTYLDARIGELRQFLEDAERGSDVNPTFDPFPTSAQTCTPAYGETCDYCTTICGCNSLDTCPCGHATPLLPHGGFWSNTLVIYLTDNGAEIQNSKANFSENGLRTPVIVKPPHFALDGNGNGAVDSTNWRRDALVGAIDVFPTILDYARHATDPLPAFPDARSVKPILVDLNAAETTWRRYFVQQWHQDAGDPIAIVDAQHIHAGASGPGRFKLTVHQPARVPWLAFDITQDPFEEMAALATSDNPIYPDNPAYLGNPQSPPIPMRSALKSKICEWDACDRAAVLAGLQTYCTSGPGSAPVVAPFTCVADDEVYDPHFASSPNDPCDYTN
jgi:arylsulfatase A-like enzyme